MTAPTVFISYSHKDEEWKDRLVTHLGVLEKEGLLDLWDDRKIEVGDDWRPEIENAIERADIAILLISANFLTSNFILDEEIPKFLARREKKGMRVFPLIVKPCAWTEVKWLSKIQARPKDGKPLSTRRAPQADTDLATFAKEIAGIVKRAESSKTSEVSETSEVWRIPPDKISLAKLPSTSPDLFGREDRLKELDAAWDSPHPSPLPKGEGTKINIFSLVAWGGVGKSALVNKWLSQMGRDNYRGAERVYGWSFYSQGAAEGRQVSADQFIAAALTWFGDPDPTAGSPWDKGERLAELIKQQRTLLILDGLEPLQNPSPVETGRIKDPALVSFLREVARQNPGLVVITTRLAVDDLKDFKDGSAKETDLESLSNESGAAYLKHLGVDGTDAERQGASHDFGGHALALTLLGRYLKVVHNGDIRKRGEIPHVMDEQKQGAHARRVMESYERWLQGKPELDILRLMGLFDRPAEKGALDALRKKPAIKGLTNAIQKLNDTDWRYAISNLLELRLLAPEDPHEPDTLDCHPLLREHFGEKLKAENIKAWQEAHGRLYEYYKSVAKEFPDTIEEMAPLFAAVMHGCQAGKHQEALDEIFVRKIDRGGGDAFAAKKLGAMGSTLTSLSGYFDPPWSKLVTGLRGDIQSYVLSCAGFCLRALGRLVEATQLLQTGLKGDIAYGQLNHASAIANNLSELYLAMGDVTQALDYARRSVDWADQSRDIYNRISGRIRLADTLHHAGNYSMAEDTFQEAERILKDEVPTRPLLYSSWGYQYCDLLLSLGRYSDSYERTIHTIEWSKEEGNLLETALEYLSLGRALFQIRINAERVAPVQNPLDHLNRAMDGMRQAGYQWMLPLGLLTRADYYRVTGALERSQKDLDEAFTIASRGGMGLHLADCHLEFARLNVAKLKGLNVQTFQPDNLPTELVEARKHLVTAKEMINKMGYHRRDKEVEELEKELS